MKKVLIEYSDWDQVHNDCNTVLDFNGGEENIDKVQPLVLNEDLKETLRSEFRAKVKAINEAKNEIEKPIEGVNAEGDKKGDEGQQGDFKFKVYLEKDGKELHWVLFDTKENADVFADQWTKGLPEDAGKVKVFKVKVPKKKVKESQELNESRNNTNRLLNLIEDGLVDKDSVIRACLEYMSEDDVTEMCRANDFFGENDNDENFRVDNNLGFGEDDQI